MGKALVLQWWGGDFGIFFERQIHDRLREIQCAIENSETWGDFAAALPDGEFEELTLWQRNGGDYAYRERDILSFAEPSKVDSFLES